MRKRWYFFLGAGLGAIGLLVFSFSARLASLIYGDDVSFPMREVEVFGEGTDEFVRCKLKGGQHAGCGQMPRKEVTAYPQFTSDKPRYGIVDFNCTADPDSRLAYHFAVDRGADRREDATRLYFDANGDRDLTNDPVLRPVEDHPAEEIFSRDQIDAVVFEEIAVSFDMRPGIAVRSFCIVPVLEIWNAVPEEERNDVEEEADEEGRGEEETAQERNGPVLVMVFAAATARSGKIRIGSKTYRAWLSQSSSITGRYDRASTRLDLMSTFWQPREDWTSVDDLGDMRWVGKKLYTTSATPTGDRLFVKQYRGPFGLFGVGPGDRDLEKIHFSGSFDSDQTTVRVGVGSGGQVPGPRSKRQCRVPVGDYLPSYLDITYGRLEIGLCGNYLWDEDFEAPEIRPPVYAIRIREGQPFVLDFSNKPEVLFVDPPKDQEFTPGDEILITALLVDPVLDIMVRGLHDTSRKKTITLKHEGKTRSYDTDFPLEPSVTVTNSSGERVAEGSMSYG